MAKARRSVGDVAAVIKCLRDCAARDTVAWLRGSKGLDRLGARAVGPLVKILGGRVPESAADAGLRVGAAKAIYAKRLHGRAAVSALVAAMGDADASVRSMSAQALARVAPLAGVAVPDAAVANVVAALAGAPKWRYATATAMSAMAVAVGARAAGAVPALIETLGDRDWEARCAALASLRHIGAAAAAAAVPELLRLMFEDPNADVRACAAGGLPEVGAAAAEAVGPLVRALGDPKAWVRQCAAGALGAYGQMAGPEGQAALEGLLGDKSPAVRKAAGEAIGKMGGA